MSNEQRAHDLTMLYIKTNANMKFKNELSETLKSNNNKIDFKLDFYQDYISIYPKILELVNRDFPQK